MEGHGEPDGLWDNFDFEECMREQREWKKEQVQRELDQNELSHRQQPLEIRPPRGCDPVKHYTMQFIRNPHWYKIYNDAPTGNSLRWRELEFAYSWESYFDLGDKCWKKWFAEQDELEKKFTLDDWTYLYKYCEDPTAKSRYKEKIEAFTSTDSVAC